MLWNLLRVRAEDGLLPAAIPDFRPRLANRCRECPRFGSVATVILDFRGSIWQSLQRMPGKSLVAAAILDFRGSTWESLQGMPRKSHGAAAIPDFRGSIWQSLQRMPGKSLVAAAILDFRPRLANRCSVIAATVRNGPPATAVVAAIFRVRFYSSLRQRRMARLQFVVAGAGGDRMSRRRHNPK